MKNVRTLSLIAVILIALFLAAATVSAQGGGYTANNVVKSINAGGFIFESYNRSNGTPYSGGQRIRIAFANNPAANICRTNGAGENGTLLGAFVFEGEPYAIARHYRKGLILLSPQGDQMATPGQGTDFCQVSRVSGDANDEDFTVAGLGQFVVVQGHSSLPSRIQLLLNGQMLARTNNSGNGDALRLLIFENRIPVIVAQNFGAGDGCTLHVTNNLQSGGTDISLDGRVANQLQNLFPQYCGTDLIPDGPLGS